MNLNWELPLHYLSNRDKISSTVQWTNQFQEHLPLKAAMPTTSHIYIEAETTRPPHPLSSWGKGETFKVNSSNGSLMEQPSSDKKNLPSKKK